MKKLSISALAILAIVFAVTSAFTVKKANSPKKFVTTYALFSVDRDEVSVSGTTPTTLSSYNNSLRVDITGAAYLNNDIGATETIASWIASNPSFPVDESVTSYYCDQSDADQVCLVKVEKHDGTNFAALSFIAGDVDITKF
jgi:hypothetical protein